ncbi:unnamed protein product, partial [Candidula unifasciata]
MGGPGVVMSSPLLKALAPYLPECLNSTASPHEDTELGRCINSRLKINCSLSFEMENKFYQNYNRSWKKFGSFHGERDRREESAWTLHAFKEPEYMFEIANKFTKGSLQGKNVNDLYNVWDTVKKKALYSVFFGKSTLLVYASVKVIYTLCCFFVFLLRSLTDLHRQTNNHTEILGLTYQHLSTDQGTQEIIFVRNAKINNKTVVPVLVRRNFVKHHVQFRESGEERGTQNDTNIIYILLTVFQKSSCYIRYVRNHKKAVDGYKGKVQLRVVLFRDEGGEHRNVSAATSALLQGSPDLDVHMMIVNETFGRARGLVLAMENLANNSLLLLMDVDMEYTSDFLYRVSRNTVMGRSVYYPIVFSQFSPEVTCYKRDNCEEFMRSFHEDVGIWRSFGYGVVSVVKQDLLRAGSLRTDIKGWGLEDIDLYEKIVTAVSTVIRAADSGILH